MNTNEPTPGEQFIDPGPLRGVLDAVDDTLDELRGVEGLFPIVIAP